MGWAILGVTVPIVGAIASTSWRLAVRLDRIERALAGPDSATLALARLVGYAWVLDQDDHGSWQRVGSQP